MASISVKYVWARVLDDGTLVSIDSLNESYKTEDDAVVGLEEHADAYQKSYRSMILVKMYSAIVA